MATENSATETSAIAIAAADVSGAAERLAEAAEAVASGSEPEPSGDDAAVRIAEIEAGRDVALAEIAAETAVTIATESVDANEGVEEWRAELAALTTNFQELNQRVTDLFSLIHPEPVQDPEEAVAEAEENLSRSTPEFTQPPTPSIETEAEPEGVEEREEPAPAPASPARRRRIPI